MAAAVGFGGVLGPLALFYGLRWSSGYVGGLLLNFEAVFTVGLGAVLSGERVGTRGLRGIALVIVGVITVGCGFYYYLKVVRAMYWQSPSKTDAIPVNGLSRVAISALIVATIWLGVYPQPIFDALKR